MKKTKAKIKEIIQKGKENYEKVKGKIQNNLKENNLLKLNKQNVKYYAVLFLMIVISVITTYANIKAYQEVRKEDYVKYEVENKAEEKKEEKEDITVNTSNVTVKEEKEEASNTPKYITAESSVMTMSSNTTNAQENITISGKLSQGYSVDKVVYYESLGLWKTHSGVDISTKASEQVVALLDGVVTKIYQDAIYGFSIEVTSKDYTCVYASLDKKIEVNVGDDVNKGQKIGYTGECAGEKNLGYHVHLEVQKDGEYVNPEILGIE